eukprot:6198138-Pleurochrysis_carterae.AAC.3
MDHTDGRLEDGDNAIDVEHQVEQAWGRPRVFRIDPLLASIARGFVFRVFAHPPPVGPVTCPNLISFWRETSLGPSAPSDQLRQISSISPRISPR